MEYSEICIPPFKVIAASDKLPGLVATYRSHAELAEDFDLSAKDGACCFFGVGAIGASWPRLVVSQRYQPAGYGFNPGILVVPQTGTVFIGAGTRLLAYELDPKPRRLWEDSAECGFWGWDQIGDVVLMSAELELAAWSTKGEKLWTTFVEPPWDYAIRGELLALNVMGKMREFPLQTGPRAG